MDWQEWKQAFDAAISRAVGAGLPDDVDEMPKDVWLAYRDAITYIGHQCGERVQHVSDHLCYCTSIGFHQEHRCGCQHFWPNDDVYTPEDGAPL